MKLNEGEFEEVEIDFEEQKKTQSENIEIADVFFDEDFFEEKPFEKIIAPEPEIRNRKKDSLPEDIQNMFTDYKSGSEKIELKKEDLLDKIQIIEKESDDNVKKIKKKIVEDKLEEKANYVKNKENELNKEIQRFAKEKESFLSQKEKKIEEYNRVKKETKESVEIIISELKSKIDKIEVNLSMLLKKVSGIDRKLKGEVALNSSSSQIQEMIKETIDCKKNIKEKDVLDAMEYNNVLAPQKIEKKCEFCGESFTAYVRDINLGWGRACSKSCAAKLKKNRKK